ncbi:hypothetical protein ERJ75_000476100 [Trypanosoma vivax]|nr:hypothetical protein ERJ75_000476100 [Trypanosoma vivax]
MKQGGHDLAKQFQTGCADARAEVVGILDPEKILDREGLHRWRDETKHLFVNQALELGRVPGLFVRHVVEEQVRAMEKSTAPRFDTIVWNNVVGKNGTIDTYVKKVVDVLNGTQLQLMVQELDNATVPLADALKAMKGLRDETKMINNEVDSVKREAFCRATVFLAKLQKRRDELVHRLSDLAPRCAAEESLESPRSMVTRTNFAVVQAQRSVLESKEKTVSVLTEAQKVMAESEHGANQRETTGKLVKIAEAREDVRRADVFVNAANGEARHGVVALVSGNNVCTVVPRTSKLETTLATAANESVLNITVHLDAIGRVPPYNEVRSSPGSCTNKHNVSSYELEALQATIANVDAFHGMDEVLDIFVALTESVRRLEGDVEIISKDAQVAIVELQKALQHAGKAAEHAECAEKAVDRADARMKEVAAMLGGVSNKNISVDAVCSLMRQLNGAKKNIMRLVQETLEDERRATDARRVAAGHGDSAPLAKKASERSAEELELVRKGARRIREGVERDIQSIDLHLVSLRNVLLNLNSGRANGSRNLTAFCDEAQDRVMGESIRVCVVRLVRSRGIADAATAHRRVRDVAADLTTLHGLSRDAGSHSERAAAYAEESIALSKGEGASRSVASARSGDAETDSGVDVARQTSFPGTSANATLSAGRDGEEEAKVVDGKLSGNMSMVMWVLVIGLSLLFLLFVFLFSLWRPIRNRAKAHVTSSEL